MKATRIIYSRLISKGNYENAKIEIEFEIEENEKASDVFQKAKEFVENRIAVEKLGDWKVKEAREILKNAEKYPIERIKESKEVLQQLEIEEDLPF